MSYLVIARKYRPQNFSEIVGQEHITRTLKNAIKLDKISHAYIFTGPRGVGKTTIARIFAKAVNCKDKVAEDPCNECVTCREITKSEAVDIIEIDAASNRGIDEIRQLKENIKFTPVNASYKVYIIDEVHMLTKEAFNAILKTLEEPPAHVIFIMATTEPEKVLDTISSRCQKFNFKLMTEKMIQENLKSIAERENIKYEEEGLGMIARASGGSIRDAQSIMDQAISFSAGDINTADVTELLGLIPRNVLFSYSDFIKDGDTKKALEYTENLLKEGYNLNRLYNDLLMHFRNLMFAKVFGKETGFLGFNEEYSEKLAECAENFSKENLIWITDFLSKNSSRIKYSENQHIVIDTIIFKLCQKYVGFDEIMEMVEKGTISVAEKPEKIVPARPVKPSQPVQPAPESVQYEPEPPSYVETPPVQSSPNYNVKPKKGGKWEQILNLIKKESQPLYHSLKDASASLKEKSIIIDYKSNLNLTERHFQILKNKIIEVMGDGYFPEINRKEVVEEPVKLEKSVVEAPPKKKFTATQIEEDEPVVGEIIDIFGGRIEKNKE